MDAQTLADVMGNQLPLARYQQYVGPFNDGMTAANCTTVNRAAMWCAQVGHESVGLLYMEEIASGAAYEWRTDLGNVYPGDGVRFKGRGPIQLTGRSNYGAFSRWCAARGYVASPTYFVDNPGLVAQPRWGFIAAAWYWTYARPLLNAYSDARDILAATRAVNGGTNGLADRTNRWKHALTLGARLLPTLGDELSAQYEADSRNRWPREDNLERDLRGDLHAKQVQLDRIEAALAAIMAKLEAKP